jgi:hypothetical protein
MTALTVAATVVLIEVTLTCAQRVADALVSIVGAAVRK